MTKIVIHSGLGNQLFQYSFAHYVNLNSSPTTKFKVLTNPKERRDRAFQLKELLNYDCIHFDKFLSPTVIYQLINLFSRAPLNKLVSCNFFKFQHQNNPFEFIKDYQFGSHILYGYYQNWKYVEDSWPVIKNELENYLTKISQTFEINNLPKNYTAIHVRRGDNIYTLESMGSLSIEYYKKVLQEINIVDEREHKFVVLTDDIVGAHDVTTQLPVSKIFGPEDMNPWQALTTMANATNVIAANSTLSWWGAFLCSKRGGNVWIPDPWFKSWPETIGDAFKHPEFNYVNSHFVKQFDTNYKIY